METLKIADAEEPKKIKKDILLRTANFQTIQTVCNDALVNNKMIAISGEPGFGKTIALQYFRATNKNVFVVTAKPSMTAKTFWLEILQAMYKAEGYPESTHQRALYFILRRISDAFNRIGSGLLVIDEAGKLNDKMLEYLHEVRDQTQTSAGIILAGPNYFKTNLVRWVQRERKGIPEFFRRINYWVELQSPTKIEVAKICEAYGVVDPDTVKVLQARCRNFGTLTNEITEYLNRSIHP